MTERDLMRALARGLRDDAVVADCMTAGLDTIAPDDTTEHAAVLMIHGGFRHLPVVDGDDVVGMLDPRPRAANARGLSAALAHEQLNRQRWGPRAVAAALRSASARTTPTAIQPARTSSGPSSFVPSK